MKKNYKKCVLVLFFVFFFFSCTNEKGEVPAVESVEQEPVLTIEKIQNDVISEYVKTLTLEQKIAQLFLVSVDGTKASLSATSYHVPPGGYILFSRNTADGEKNIITLIGDTITHYNKQGEILPYFSIDHEGGIVNRLRDVASPLPSAQSVAQTLTVQKAQELYSLSAKQLKALGIHINIGPMAEATFESNADFMGTRSFGDISSTIAYSNAFLSGFRNEDIYCVVKHFPGNSNDDPHYFLPTITGDKQSILNFYVKPFSSLVGDDGLLMSHAIVPSFDDIPACLSPLIVNELVNGTLGFDGLLFSDDILMSALLENGYPPEIAISMALKAGVNVLMISHPAYWNIIPIVVDLVQSDSSLEQYIDISVQKILEAKLSMDLYEVSENIIDESDTIYSFQAVQLSTIYNVERQLIDFYSARDLGIALYNEFW